MSPTHSRRHRSPLPTLMALGLALAGIAAAVVWWRSGPVDPALVGRWQTVAELADGSTRTAVMDVARSGEVVTERRTRGNGRFVAADGRWHLETSGGAVFEGRYAMTAPGRVIFKGFPFGGESWQREVMPEGGGPLAGRWRGTAADANAEETALIVDADGRYRFAQTTQLHSVLSARDGRWRMTAADGRTDVGRYHFADDGTIVVSLADGPTTWRGR